MVEILTEIIEFIQNFWHLLTLVLRLTPELMAQVALNREMNGLILAIVFLGGASLLIGQSVILFVNKVTPRRYLLSLLLSGFLLAFELVAWAASMWVSSDLLFRIQMPFGATLRVAGLSYAPYTFGFLILVPYLGNPLQKLLSVWSFLIAFGAIRFFYSADFIPALLCVGLGWVFLHILTHTIGKPLAILRNWFVERVVGSQLEFTPQDILNRYLPTRQPDAADYPPADSSRESEDQL